MSYKSTRRQWVKLWVNEWLDGTTRFKLTSRQRLLWVDLLALAGRSRWPGLIYAGENADGSKVGYPLAWLSGVLGFDPIDLNNALKVLEHHGHITMSEKDESVVLGIANWNKYQSEYLRQRGYRKVTTDSTSRLPVEGEGDKEVEGETPFSVFWDSFPRKVGKAKCEKLWQGFSEMQRGFAMKGLLLWKRAEQWNRDDGKFIPYASTFLAQKRYL